LLRQKKPAVKSAKKTADKQQAKYFWIPHQACPEQGRMGAE